MSPKTPPTLEYLRQKYLGAEVLRTSQKVEIGAINKFLDAIGNADPQHSTDQPNEHKSEKHIVAPPTFLRTLNAEHPTQLNEFPYDRIFDGGSEWEYLNPVCSDDIISAVTSITRIYERTGRSGQLLFIVTETTYTNQHNRIVAKQESTSIKY